jgi:hypothetical protein
MGAFCAVFWNTRASAASALLSLSLDAHNLFVGVRIPIGIGEVWPTIRSLLSVFTIGRVVIEAEACYPV